MTTTQVGTSKLAPPWIEPLAISASEITPIVFWASLVPWASATIDEEATCNQRNSRSARSSWKRADQQVDDRDADRGEQPGEDR